MIINRKSIVVFAFITMKIIHSSFKNRNITYDTCSIYNFQFVLNKCICDEKSRGCANKYIVLLVMK